MVRRKQKSEETAILEAIRATFPSFLPNVDFELESSETPDFLGKDENGLVIGLELTRWLNLSQTAEAVKRERTRQTLLRTINCTAHPHIVNISTAVLFPHWERKLEKRHAQPLCDEFHSLAELISNKWISLRRDHWRPLLPEERFDHEAHLSDYKQYTVLSRYVSSVWFREPDRTDSSTLRDSWVSVISDGGFYQTESSIQALRNVMEKKFILYDGGAPRAALAAKNVQKLILLVYTDVERFSTNTSYQTPDQMMKSPTEGLAEAATKATEKLGSLPTTFSAVFLFYSAWGSSWLAEVWPNSCVHSAAITSNREHA